jgi:hypothetical protein
VYKKAKAFIIILFYDSYVFFHFGTFMGCEQRRHLFPLIILLIPIILPMETAAKGPLQIPLHFHIYKFKNIQGHTRALTFIFIFMRF